MKLMKVMLLAAMVMASATAVHAANMTFGLGGGITVPTSDLKDITKTGFNGGVYGDYWIKDDYAFGIDVTGNFLKGSDDIITALKSPGYTDPSLTFTLISFGVHGIWAPAMKDMPAQPWITYGVGIYNGSTKISDTDPAAQLNGTESKSKFGFNGGVGVDFKATEMVKVGADFKYHYVLDAVEKDNGSGGTEKKAGNYFTAGLHVTFSTSGGK